MRNGCASFPEECALNSRGKEGLPLWCGVLRTDDSISEKSWGESPGITRHILRGPVSGSQDSREGCPFYILIQCPTLYGSSCITTRPSRAVTGPVVISTATSSLQIHITCSKLAASQHQHFPSLNASIATHSLRTPCPPTHEATLIARPAIPERMMSSTNEEDPFLQVQQYDFSPPPFPPRFAQKIQTNTPSPRDVLAQLSSTRPLFASYLRIRSLSTTPSSPELASARTDLESALASLAEDLSDLVASVQAIESNPSQYGISTDEVARRRRLVQEVGGEIEDMREELTEKLGGSTAPAPAPAGRLPDPDCFAVGGEAEADAYAEFEQQQVEMMREQDEHLDGVFQTVGSLRRQADDMGRELEEQGEMLDGVDETVDRVGGRLQSGMQKLQFVMRKNEDRWSSFCIGVLIFVLILLLFLLLSL